MLAIQGEDDEFFSPAQLGALGQLLPGRLLQTMIIAGCGHYPLHQARNETLAASIRFVLSALGASFASSASAAGGARAPA